MAATDYSIWNLLWLVVLFAPAPWGPSLVSVVAQFVLMTLAISSHAVSVVALPLCLYNIWAYPALASRMANADVLLVIGAYQLWGLETHSPAAKPSLATG